MKHWIALVWLLTCNVAIAQSDIPYDQTWAGFPFVSSFQKVLTMKAISYHSAKDLKRKVRPNLEETHFDSLGRDMRTILEWAGSAKFYECWKYKPDGCPFQVYCEQDSVKFRNPSFTCQDGKIDTLFGTRGSLQVRDFNSSGRFVSEKQFEKDYVSDSFRLKDHILLQYDTVGRYVGSIGRDFEIQVRYFIDSLVIEKSVKGKIISLREIKCGRYGLPILMKTWSFDNRKRKPVLVVHSTLTYVFRDE